MKDYKLKQRNLRAPPIHWFKLKSAVVFTLGFRLFFYSPTTDKRRIHQRSIWSASHWLTTHLGSWFTIDATTLAKDSDLGAALYYWLLSRTCERHRWNEWSATKAAAWPLPPSGRRRCSSAWVRVHCVFTCHVEHWSCLFTCRTELLQRRRPSGLQCCNARTGSGV